MYVVDKWWRWCWMRSLRISYIDPPVKISVERRDEREEDREGEGVRTERRKCLNRAKASARSMVAWCRRIGGGGDDDDDSDDKSCFQARNSNTSAINNTLPVCRQPTQGWTISVQDDSFLDASNGPAFCQHNFFVCIEVANVNVIILFSQWQLSILSPPKYHLCHPFNWFSSNHELSSCTS